MNKVQIQNIQLANICRKVATKLREESTKKLPELKKHSAALKKSFLESKDVFKKAETAWLGSPEYLDYAAKKRQIKKVPFFEKVLSHIKTAKNYFINKRKNKLCLLQTTLDELEANPNTLFAKYKLAEKNKNAAHEALRHANGKKNKTFAEKVLGGRLERIPDTQVVKNNITNNINEINKEKRDLGISLSRVQTKLNGSILATELNKAKKIVKRGRRTFLQFIKRIPKAVALEQNQQRLQEAKRRYQLSSDNKTVTSLRENIALLAKKLRKENLVKRYSDGILDKVERDTNVIFAKEAGHIVDA